VIKAREMIDSAEAVAQPIPSTFIFDWPFPNIKLHVCTPAASGKQPGVSCFRPAEFLTPIQLTRSNGF
jgi:hypothetical protein